MPYEPPAGWVEELPTDDAVADRFRFHTSEVCGLIRDGQQLVAVPQPFSATRCPRCAAD